MSLEWQECRTCNGTGKVDCDCSTYYGEDYYCYDCGGHGEKQCPEFYGSGGKYEY